MKKSFDWQLKPTLKKQESNTWFSTEIKMDMLHKLPNNKLLIPSCVKWMASSITEMLNTLIWTKRNRQTLLNYLWVKSWITWRRNYKSKKSKTNKYLLNLTKLWNKRKYIDPGLTSWKLNRRTQAMVEHQHLDLIKQRLREKSLLQQHLMSKEAVDCLSEIAKDKKQVKKSNHKLHQERLKVLLTGERTEVT